MRVVQKFGGTSVGSLERIRNTASLIEDSVRKGHETAVVVSAMSGETNRLLGMARELCEHPQARELDALVSTGEQVSAALLAIELHKRGIGAYSYTGMQAGFFTDSHHSRARIRRIECKGLLEHLEQGEVPVLAGFQGVDEQGNITTLGRGGSDTSAVALALALKADVCDIYTDVDGIYTTDPRIVPTARKIDRISYEEMLELASQGAKVLQNRSVELAMRNTMPIHLRSSFEDVSGTLVTSEDETMERASITGVAYNRDEAKITIRGIPDHPGIASNVFGPIAAADINVDVIVQNVSEDGTTDITFTVPRDDFGSAMQTFETLAKESINIQMITTSEIKITVVIDETHVELAVHALHSAFDLDAED